MAREKQDITDAEMAIMQVLWRRAEAPPSATGIPGASTRQIADEIYGERAGPTQYATVQKQLERLEAKGFVRRDRSLFVHLFSAGVGRDELIGRRLREMADKLCEGSLAPVLSHLFKAKALTEQERRALRTLIDDTQAEAPSADDVAGGRSGRPRRPKRTR
jgi:BlaI family penicillinase repressor